MLKIVECADDAFDVVESVVEVFGCAFGYHFVEVGEAEVWVEVVALDVVFVVEG